MPRSVLNCVPKVIFVLGGPGTGKSTICARIVQKNDGWSHISAGNCLRKARESLTSPSSPLIDTYLKAGMVVPAGITVRLLQKAMLDSDTKKFLIDGFPRNLENLHTWDEIMGNAARLVGVLSFECSEKLMRHRCLSRGLSSGRSDDNEETLVKRFNTHKTECMAVMEVLAQKGLVTRVDASTSVEDMWPDVMCKIMKMEAGFCG